MSRLVVQLFALAQIMMASRFIGLAEFGSYALAWACVAIFSAFVFTGYYQAFLRSEHPDEDRHTTFGMMLAFALVASLVLLAAGMSIGEGLVARIFLSFALLPIIEAVYAWNEVHLLRETRMRTISLIGAASEALATLVLALGLFEGLGPMALVAARYAATGLNLTISTFLVRRFPRPSFDRAVLRKGRRTAIPLWISTGAAMLANYGIDLILGIFLNPSQVGTYRGGARISQTAADLVQQPLTVLTWSRFSRLAAEQRGRLITLAWRVNMSFGTSVAWPLMLCVALLSKELVTVILDDAWLPTAAIISILSLVRAIRILTSQLEPTLTSLDRQGLQLAIRLFGLTFTFLAILVFGRSSAESTAIVQVYTSVIVALISLELTRQVLNISPGDLFRTFLPGLLLSGLCGGFVMATEPLRVALAPASGLFLTLVGLLVVWSGAVALSLWKGFLRWPTP
ncbi:oligosaccharide flippase family protein [Marimonas lutisalis]|uniref:oligosaccharide flippase family protein n=1 Tax=Marimonas lutisalis TaxID=2545756 RepID=UPI0010F68E72|nr:oligosaccharide flippase family protein [Marimonas lutisalis]